MSQQERCEKCGSTSFAVVRDMTSRRICSCGNSWPVTSKKAEPVMGETKPRWFESKEVLEFRCFIQYNKKENDWWFECMGPTADHNFIKGVDNGCIIELVEKRHLEALKAENEKLQSQLAAEREVSKRLVEALEFNVSKHNQWIDQGHWCDSKKVLQSIVDSSKKALSEYKQKAQNESK